MPVQYVGSNLGFKGKSLFEILCNLKNFGIGRKVVRSLYERYPEASYYEITKVEPEMDEYNRKGIAWGRQIFRGRDVGERKLNLVTASDWRLLHKHEEEAYIKRDLPPFQIRLLPKYGQFPPLLKYMIQEDRTRLGLPTNEEPKLEMVYNKRDLVMSRYRMTADGETPNVKMADPDNLSLYANVKWTKEPKQKKEGDI